MVSPIEAPVGEVHVANDLKRRYCRGMPPRVPRFSLAVILKGFGLAFLLYLPLALLLLVFIGIMAAAAPGAPSPLESFAIVAVFIFLVPPGVFLAHIVLAKIGDAALFIVSPIKCEWSILGLLFSAVALVVLGNIFVDDLYQFRQGHYAHSIMALGVDLGALAIVIALGHVPIPFIDRRFVKK